MYIYAYICIYKYIHICIFIYIYMYIHIYLNKAMMLMPDDYSSRDVSRSELRGQVKSSTYA
jgi:hypothetical protein